jgi:hypothetical protein
VGVEKPRKWMPRSVSTGVRVVVVVFDKFAGAVEGSRVSERVPLLSVEKTGTGSVVGEVEPILVHPSWRES